MKRNLQILGLALLAVTFITACSKKSSSTSSPYTMSATKGGSTVSISGQSNVVAVVAGPILEIVGLTTSGSDSTGLIFYVANYTGVGSYTIDGAMNTAEYVSKTSSTTGTLILGTSGTLTITSATSPYMKGTFHFSDGTNSITNGVFTAHF